MLNFSIIASLATASNYTSHFTSYPPSSYSSKPAKQPLTGQTSELKSPEPSAK